MSASEGIANFAAFIGAIVPIVGLYLAWLGLNTWKNQKIWQADNDLARRMLIAAYRFQNSLYAVRHPAMSQAEMVVDNPDGNTSNDESGRRGVIEAYGRRWEGHLPKRNDLDALLIESDAVWGNELSNLLKALYELEQELFMYIQLYLKAHYHRETDIALEYRKLLSKRRDVLFDMMSDDDPFRIDFVQRLIPVEDYLRHKLGRGK